MPKVSIIVPIYNVEKYLPQCMESLLNQTLADIEIILVDDGSPDNCPAMCDEYAKQDHRVRVIHKANAGQGYARNSGLEIATGEYIAFVDSDDYVETATYQEMYALITSTKADAVYFAFQMFDNQENVFGEASTSKEGQYQTKDDVRGLMLNMIANHCTVKSRRDIQCSACCSLYRNDIIKNYGLKFKSERELYCEDLLFNLDYLLNSSNVITVVDTFYKYRVNVSSTTKTVRPDRVDKYYFFYQYLLEMLSINNFGTEGYLRATRQFIDYSRDGINKYLRSSLITRKEKIHWLKEVVNKEIWKEIAVSFPYKKLPLKHALHFYLLNKRHYHLLYLAGSI